jgi:hypothetical protein
LLRRRQRQMCIRDRNKSIAMANFMKQVEFEKPKS